MPGTWTRTKDPCICFCPLTPPDIEVWIRVDQGDGEGFSDWLLDTFQPVTSFPEQTVQVQFRFSSTEPNGTWFLRVREISLDRNGGEPFVYSSPTLGDIITLTGIGGVFLTETAQDYLEISHVPDVNVERWIVGAPSKGNVTVARAVQGASARKYGFPVYNADASNADVYRTETISGSYPGGEGGSAPRTYSGSQSYTTAGVYSSSLSSGVKIAGIASYPGNGTYRIPKTFGTVEQTADTRTMRRDYVDDDGNARVELATLTLSNPTSTDDIETAVQDDLDGQSHTLGSFFALPDPFIQSSHLLTPGERLHERLESQCVIAATPPMGAYLAPGADVAIVVTFTRRVYSRLTGAPSESVLTRTIHWTVQDDGSVDTPYGRTLLPTDPLIDGLPIDDEAGDNTFIELVDFSTDELLFLAGDFRAERAPEP